MGEMVQGGRWGAKSGDPSPRIRRLDMYEHNWIHKVSLIHFLFCSDFCNFFKGGFTAKASHLAWRLPVRGCIDCFAITAGLTFWGDKCDVIMKWRLSLMSKRGKTLRFVPLDIHSHVLYLVSPTVIPKRSIDCTRSMFDPFAICNQTILF